MRRGWLSGIFKKSALALGLGAVISGCAGTVMRPGKTVEDVYAEIVRDTPPRTRFSHMVADAYVATVSDFPDAHVAYIDPDKIDFAIGQTRFVAGEFVDNKTKQFSVGNETKPFIDTAFQRLNKKPGHIDYEIYKNEFEKADPGSVIYTIRNLETGKTGGLCAVFPGNPNQNIAGILKQVFLVRESSNIMFQHMIRFKDLSVFFVDHEFGHCTNEENYNIKLPEFVDPAQPQDREMIVKAYSREAYSDLLFLQRRVNKGQDLYTAAQVVADFRNLLTSAAATGLTTGRKDHNKSYIVATYYTVPAVHAFVARIEALGADTFRSFSPGEQDNFLFDTLRAAGYAWPEILAMRNYVTTGEMPENENALDIVQNFRRHAADVRAEFIKGLDPVKYIPVMPGHADKDLDPARRAVTHRGDSSLARSGRIYRALMREAPFEIGSRARKRGGFSKENIEQAAADWIDDLRSEHARRDDPGIELETKLNLLRGLIREGYIATPNARFRAFSHHR